ncbi:MAG: FkbM family methyltransferase [Flavobacteriales bacterium]|nr:FkbM family methyltransferase [Flavobacteriales bacterium]MCB9364760.1 FkbM family methyltransferase [Flavobacteriales bacterium]
MLRTLIHSTLNSLNLLSFYSLKKSGYLFDQGWFYSFKAKKPIDKENNPIPWMTYSFIDFISSRLNSNMKIFEYGSGNSTLWWSKRVKTIVSCEHDKLWYNSLLNDLPENVTLEYKEVKNGNYARKISEYVNEFDIIIIDGRDRISCAKNSLLALKKDGIIIWDNSDRKEYQEGYNFLTSQGFKRIDFIGLGPINVMPWATSVFYKSDNCLNL